MPGAVFHDYDVDRVIHFAAESHVDRSIREPELFVKTNVLGTANMLNCAKEAWELPGGSFREGKKFCHVSTDEVYGSLPEDPDAYFYETTPYQPHSPYSASKASSDMLVKAYHDTYGRWRAGSFRFTATAGTSATGCMSRTTARQLIWYPRRASAARPTMSADTTRSRILRS